MRLRPHRRNLVIWRQSARSPGRYRTAPVTRPARASRIRRLLRTGVLLTVVRLLSLARNNRARWVLAGLVLSTAGIVYRANPAGVILLPGLFLVVGAPLVPAGPKADRVRYAELERELAGYSTPAQRRDLEALLDGCPDGITHEIRDILAGQAAATRSQRIPGA
jgi:hypothetical protein